MANYATLKAAIQAVIKTNGNEEITGALLQQSLLAMINSLGGYYQFAGIATPTTNPGTPDQNVYYIASTAGTYTNFGGLVLADGEIAILKYNGAWSKDSTGAASLEAVNQLEQQLNGTPGSSAEVTLAVTAGTGVTTNGSLKTCLLEKGRTYRVVMSGAINTITMYFRNSDNTGGVTVDYDGQGASGTNISFTPSVKEHTITPRENVYYVRFYAGASSITVTGDMVWTFLSEGANGIVGDIEDLTEDVGALASEQSEIRQNAPIYDVTLNVPLQSGYYTYETAIAAVPAEYRKFGLVLKFYDGTAWRYEQFVGSSVVNWSILSNWKMKDVPYVHLLGTVFKNVDAINYGYYPYYFPIIDIYTVQNTHNKDICLDYISRTSNRFSIAFIDKIGGSNVAAYTTQSLSGLSGRMTLRCSEQNNSGVIIDVIIDFDLVNNTNAWAFNNLNAEIVQKQNETANTSAQVAALNSQVAAFDSKISSNTIKIGAESASYIETRYDGVFWGGNKVYEAVEAANGIIIKLNLGAKYSWKNTTYVSGTVWDHRPVVNDVVHTDVSSGFVATEGQNYLLLSFQTARVPNGVSITIEGLGLFRTWGYMTLAGKKILCLGESTTEFTDESGKNWPAYAADYTEGTFITGAIGGTRLSQRTTPADVPSTVENSYASLDMCNLIDSWIANDWTRVDAAVEWIKNNASDDNSAIIQNLKDNPISSIDMIVILGGGNDMNSATPLGAATDKNKTSILGAINYILDAILTANPKVKIYWASLMARYYGKTWDSAHWSDNEILLTYNKTTPQVIEDMAAVVKTYHIQWCDLYWTLFNEYNAKSYYTKYYGDGDSRNDPSHPWGGFDVIGRKIGSFLLANRLV